MSLGTRTAASVRKVAYSAYPPSIEIPRRAADKLTTTHRLGFRMLLTVDSGIFASYVVADAAARAFVAVASMPAAADAVANLPFRLVRRDRDDVADDLVAWDSRVLDGVDCLGDLLIANQSSNVEVKSELSAYRRRVTQGRASNTPAADTARDDFDDDLAVLGILPGDGDPGQFAPLLSEGVCGVGFGVVGRRHGCFELRSMRVILAVAVKRTGADGVEMKSTRCPGLYTYARGLS
ncbi:hypothetical protein BD309DRAFT_420172 [Dichomitus squalens]|nr:hypothetical protein BD309DRAFT_420172 [Dichomitus squalens]